MGYTHYWRLPREIPQDQWDRFSEACDKIVRGCGVPLSYEHNDPNTAPQTDAMEVRFNGPRADGYETFLVKRCEPINAFRPSGLRADRSWAFCKTERKPYDLPVMACLIALAHHVPTAVVSSDGDDRTGEDEWAAGRALAEQILGATAVAAFRLHHDSIV